jgi:RNA polymerase sigma factor (sigma-70 family)
MKPQTIPASSPSSELAQPRPEGEGRVALVPDAPSERAVLALHREPVSFAQHVGTILRRYGGEVRAFLGARTSSRASMDEVYSAFSEDVWKGLPQVRAQDHVRGWLYVVARNALARHLRSKLRWRSRHVTAELDELQVEARRSLATHLGQRDRLEEVLAQLDPEDRRLLELRSMLAMPWREIAAQRADAEDVERESARLRKRYQLLLQRLRDGLASLRNSLTG